MTDVNPYTGRPYSKRYHDILKTRQKLPVYEAKDRIQSLVQRYQTLLLVGETGSGKTTQVPQFLLELCPEGAIACTQPRRVAAMSVSERVAEEMDVTLGDEVGYTIRFEDVSSEKTRIKYMTDGMLLREAMTDPLLTKYSVIVLDEAHERTVHTDILIGTVKDLISKRPDLRVVVMSATLEEKKFQQYFTEAPLIHISGRMFGVELYYSKAPEANYVEAAIRTTTQIHLFEGPGDILVFLCGEDEIETACERLASGMGMAAAGLEGAENRPFEVLPLYSSLPPQAQRKVFRPVPEGTRKIVVATNIAETSLTIDGVVFVVDCGFSKQKVYNPKLRVESLLVTPISQASANQRCGRAGRTRPGKCFRLYTKKSFEKDLQPQTYPEILRCNLGSIVLHMKKMGIDDLVHFDFVDPPAPETLMRALELLNFLGALDDDGNLTPYGARLAEFPLEPEMAAMVMAGEEFECTDSICRVAAMMSVQNPFIMPPNHEHSAAVRAKGQFFHQTGDHMALLQVFNAYEESKYSADWCKTNYINSRCMSQAASIYRQLLGIQRRIGMKQVESRTENMQFGNHIRRAILRGFFSKVCMSLPTKNQFITLKDNVKALFFPTTFLNRRPQFVVFNELVLTSNTYIRTCTAISDDWLIEACPRYFDLEDFDGTVLQVMQQMHRRYKQSIEKADGAKKRPRVEDSDDSDSD